jgi:DNA-binding NtrC family response regulator
MEIPNLGITFVNSNKNMPQKPFRVFIVEDDPFYGEILSNVVSNNPDWAVSRFSSGKECVQNLYLEPDLISLDHSLPDGRGDKFLSDIKTNLPDCLVVIVSAQEEISTAISLLKEGADDYLEKNEDAPNRFFNIVTKHHETVSLRRELANLRGELSLKFRFDQILKGNSPSILNAHLMMEKAAKTAINVLILGETGTGKELVAKAIHYHSDRHDKPFVILQGGGAKGGDLDFELFGAEKGALPMVQVRRKGKFEEANGGTLFIDEVCSFDALAQSKLFRILRDKMVTRLGGNTSVPFSVRLIVSTKRNLFEEVKKGNFLEDLYYSLMGLPIHLPALKERSEDIIPLARYFLDEFATGNKVSKFQISPDASKKLIHYSWPGNIRELKNVVEMAAVMSNSGIIQEEDCMLTLENERDNLFNKELTLKEYNIRIIQRFLQKYEQNIPIVAEKLDIGKSTIYRMYQNGELT